MIMLILLEGDVLQIDTDAATDCSAHVSYVDKSADGSVINAARVNVPLSGGSDTYDLLSGPAAGVERNVQLITVSNDDADDPVGVKLIHSDGTTRAAFHSWDLLPLEARFWPDLGKDGEDGENETSLGFLAGKSVSQAIGASATTKLAYGSEVYDVGGYYDSTLSRWTPPAGRVTLVAGVISTGTVGGGNLCQMHIYKNGASFKQMNIPALTNAPSLEVVAHDNANGTDYYEAYCFIVSTGDTTAAAGTGNFFSGVWHGNNTGEGPQGDDGTPGLSFHQGAGAPSNGLGNDGDTYLDTQTGRIYLKTAGSWGTHVTTIVVPGTNIAGGFTTTSVNAGTKSSGTFTPDPLLGNVQHYVNGGAHTLAPPSAPCTMIIQMTNASAGAVTVSGFSLVTGDAIDTSGTRKHLFQIVKSNDYSHLHVSTILEGGESFPSPMLNGFPIANGKLVLSASAGALTAAIKTHAGNDPSPAFPVYVTTPAIDGGYVVTKLTAAKSIVVPSGAELGVAGTGLAFRLWFGAAVHSATFKLIVKNCRGSNGGYATFNTGEMITATLISTGADAAITNYCTDADINTSTPMMVLASAEWNDLGLAALGTWTITGLRNVVQHAAGSPTPGYVLQSKVQTLTARGTATNSTSYQDTNVTQSITPISASNGIRVSYTGGIGIGHGGANAGNAINMRFVRNTGTVQLGANFQLFAPGNGVNATYGFPVTYSKSRLDFPNKLLSSETYKAQICSNNSATDVTLPYGNPGDIMAEYVLEEVLV